MGSFRLVTKKELRAKKKMSEEDRVLFDRFKEFLARLDSRYAGIYEFSSGEDHDKCKKMLRKAASALEIRIRVKGENNSLVFYRTTSRRDEK